jgi:hypothetical protein
MSIFGWRRLGSWEGPGHGIDGRGNLGGSGWRVYHAQGSAMASYEAGGIPAGGFGKALGWQNEDFGDRLKLSISAGYDRIPILMSLRVYLASLTSEGEPL